jgi:hypothetical protein
MDLIIFVCSEFRYLLIECEDHDVGVKQDPRVREMYLTVMQRFLTVCSCQFLEVC